MCFNCVVDFEHEDYMKRAGKFKEYQRKELKMMNWIIVLKNLKLWVK